MAIKITEWPAGFMLGHAAPNGLLSYPAILGLWSASALPAMSYLVHTGTQAEGAELAIALPATSWCLAAPAHLPTHCPQESSSSAQQHAQDKATRSPQPHASISPNRHADGASTRDAAEGSGTNSNDTEHVHSAAAGSQEASQPSGSVPEDLGTSAKSDSESTSIPLSALTDPAAIQLEALRCLLLLLPACLHQVRHR